MQKAPIEALLDVQRGFVPVNSHLLAVFSVEFGSNAENSFSARKPDKMRALSATHT
jgi:hypothetical protein